MASMKLRRKSRTYSPKPSHVQTGVFGYHRLEVKANRISGKTRKRRAKALRLAHERDAIRQEVDRDNGIDFNIVHQLLGKGKTLKEAKRLAYMTL